jgi:hypothetical protein
MHGLLRGNCAHVRLGRCNESSTFALFTYRSDADERKKRMQDLETLIIYGCEFLGSEYFSRLNSYLQHFRESKEPFGGLQLLLSADLFNVSDVICHICSM